MQYQSCASILVIAKGSEKVRRVRARAVFDKIVEKMVDVDHPSADT